MKTPEDEAFDDLARKQGDWGGGFPAKRQMAADKLLEPVECLDCGSNNVGIPATYDSLVDSVKSQPAQEPVAFICQGNLYMAEDVDEYCTATHIPLYTTPPKREWVGLKPEEINAVDKRFTSSSSFYAGALWAQAKLKEKNA